MSSALQVRRVFVAGLSAGLRVSAGAACALAPTGCVDTQPPALTGPGLADGGLGPWDAGSGSLKPPVAPASASNTRRAAEASERRDDAGAKRPGVAGPAVSDGRDAGGAVRATGQNDAMGAAMSTPITVTMVARPVAAGDLIISELMVDPKTLPDSQGEWFELYNPSDRAFSLQECQLDDGAKSPHRITPVLVVEPGAYVSVARQLEPGFVPDATASLSLTNSADTLALVCGSVEIDRVTYDKAAGFGIVPGASLSLDPHKLDARDNDLPSSWCAGQTSYGGDLGSPGRENPDCATDEADAGSPALPPT